MQLGQLKADLLKKEEQLTALKKTSEITETELKTEIDKLKDQSKKDKEEFTKMLEKKSQVSSSKLRRTF